MGATLASLHPDEAGQLGASVFSFLLAAWLVTTAVAGIARRRLGLVPLGTLLGAPGMRRRSVLGAPAFGTNLDQIPEVESWTE